MGGSQRGAVVRDDCIGQVKGAGHLTPPRALVIEVNFTAIWAADCENEVGFFGGFDILEPVAQGALHRARAALGEAPRERRTFHSGAPSSAYHLEAAVLCRDGEGQFSLGHRRTLTRTWSSGTP